MGAIFSLFFLLGYGAYTLIKWANNNSGMFSAIVTLSAGSGIPLIIGWHVVEHTLSTPLVITTLALMAVYYTIFYLFLAGMRPARVKKKFITGPRKLARMKKRIDKARRIAEKEVSQIEVPRDIDPKKIPGYDASGMTASYYNRIRKYEIWYEEQILKHMEPYGIAREYVKEYNELKTSLKIFSIFRTDERDYWRRRQIANRLISEIPEPTEEDLNKFRRLRRIPEPINEYMRKSLREAWYENEKEKVYASDKLQYLFEQEIEKEESL